MVYEVSLGSVLPDLYFPGCGPAFHSHCVSGAPTPGALGGGQKPARIFRLLGGFVKGFSAWPDVPTGLRLGEGGCAHSSLQHTHPMPLLGLPWPPPAPPAQKHSLGRCSESRRRCNLSYFSRKKMPESSGYVKSVMVRANFILIYVCFQLLFMESRQATIVFILPSICIQQ